MGAWSYVRSIYALDTIDTRFTSSASTPHKAVADVQAEYVRPSSKKDGSARKAPAPADSSLVQPSKWNTPEFYFYYLVFLTCIPYMFWIAYDVSRRECHFTSEYYISDLFRSIR
jgi:protein-cysteine N-palmitoyltransferase HHAT